MTYHIKLKDENISIKYKLELSLSKFVGGYISNIWYDQKLLPLGWELTNVSSLLKKHQVLFGLEMSHNI